MQNQKDYDILKKDFTAKPEEGTTMAKYALVYEHRLGLAEAMTALRDSTRPWKLSALWRAKGCCFHKLRRNGTIRLYRTGDRLGFCWADLRMRPVRGGGTLMEVTTATTAGAKWLAWLLCVICLFTAVYDCVELGGVQARDWPYFLLCAVAVVLAGMTGRETPRLLQFLEQELGWRRAR